MISSLRLVPAAEADLEAAFWWYEERRVGLGVRFVDAVDLVLGRIRESPRLVPEIAPGLRRGLLAAFRTASTSRSNRMLR